MMIKLKTLFIFFLFFFPFCIFSSLSYSVKFIGLKDKAALSDVKRSCQLVNLQSRPPRSINALHYRADNDIVEMIKVLHAYGYYDAIITTQIEEKKGIITVSVIIDPGKRYILASYKIFHIPCDSKINCEDKSLEKILPLGKPAISKNIVQLRRLILLKLAQKGYPLAKVEKQDVFVDLKEKTVNVEVDIDTGPLAHFGNVTIIGLDSINQEYIKKKIDWHEGQIYSTTLVENTQKKLLNTELFSSILVSHENQVDENGNLPMKILLKESKHKNIGFGFSYATIDGFGVNFSWTNRNFRSLGELLTLEGEIYQKGHEGSATYRKTDFLSRDQDLVNRFLAKKIKLHLYNSYTYSLLSRLDRKVGGRTRLSFGLRGEYIDVYNSENNGLYTLLNAPILLQYIHSNHLLNPTQGYTFTYRLCPNGELNKEKIFFMKQTLIATGYIPNATEKIVLAFRCQIGSIVGPSISHIPLTKVFLGGSDDNLRGYRYRTVSPKNQNGTPEGGKGVIYFSFEPRFRLTKTIGLVPFTDIGTVSKKAFPSPNQKWYKSVGIGLRYFTFFGPLRGDIGFPLNRRKGIDPKFRIYASIGQTF